jgi:hypothetical protein
MSRYINIFVEAEESFEEFVSRMASLLDLDLKPQRDDYDYWYSTANPRFYLDVTQHELENDEDKLFENYRYQIAIRPFKVVTEEDWEQAVEQIGQPVYDKLKTLDRYPLMMTDDVDVKLDEYEPASPAAKVGARR